MIDLVIISVLPSPYQVDLFDEIASQNSTLKLYYLEEAAPDSPWNKAVLPEYASILKGFWLGKSPQRILVNYTFPLIPNGAIVILNIPYTAITFQLLLRSVFARKNIRWYWFSESIKLRHGLLGEIQTKFLKSARKMDGYIAIGSAAEKQFKDLFPNKRILNQAYAINPSAYQKIEILTANSKSEINVLFCGQIIERKGVDILLQALSAVQNPNLRITIIGREGDWLKIKETLPKSVYKQINYLGFVQPHDLPSHFLSADYFALPSRYDGWGVVVNQALAAGLPCLISPHVGAAQLIVDHKNGWVIPNNSIENWRKQLTAILDINQEDYLQMKASAKQSALEMDAQTAAKRILQFVGLGKGRDENITN